MGQTKLLVCKTCKGLTPEAEVRAGQRLADALLAAHQGGFEIAEVECLSNCKRSCSVALVEDGKWTYVYGDLDPDTPEHITDLLDGAGKYAQTEDGLIPWRDRPQIMRKGVVARIPPLNSL